MPAVPARGHEAVSERRALPQREVRHRKAQLRSRTAWQRPQGEAGGLRPAASRKAEGAPHLRRAGNPVPQQFRKGRASERHHRRELFARSSAAWTTSFIAWASAPAAPRPARSCATATSRSTAARSISPRSRSSSATRSPCANPAKNNPTILAARDATAHAPSPNWMDVDRENLKGNITGLPKRDELVQIPINEQLIVELYSK